MESSLGNKSTCIKNSQTAAGLIGEPVGYMLYTRHQTSQMPGKNAKSLQKKICFRTLWLATYRLWIVQERQSATMKNVRLLETGIL